MEIFGVCIYEGLGKKLHGMNELPQLCKQSHIFCHSSYFGIFIYVQVDAMFGLTQHAGLLRSLLTTFTKAQNRQTIFASATIPQHSQFIRKCISEKWVKVRNLSPFSPFTSRLLQDPFIIYCADFLKEVINVYKLNIDYVHQYRHVIQTELIKLQFQESLSVNLLGLREASY